MHIDNTIIYLICVLLHFLPFWLFERLLKKRQGEQRGYGDDNNYSGPIGPVSSAE